MDPKVFVFKSGLVYKVDPPTLQRNGGDKFFLVNATDQGLVARFPKGSADAGADVEHVLAAGKKVKVDTVSQGSDTTRAYQYRVRMDSGEDAQGNSDPILIIEN